MGQISDQWTRPRRARDSFPPYVLGDRSVEQTLEAKTKKVGRIYQKGHDLAWDGPKTLDALIAKHGGLHFPEDRKEAFAAVASVLLWGELAAWSISADLALKLEDHNAKMAASSQVFDEARHFHTLREYLWRAEIDVPPLRGYSRTMLVMLLETDNLLHKLVGMQLLVENIAVGVFKSLAKAELEPVLTDLLYYFERDEARHVGLGALVLPPILADLSDLDAARLWWFQLRLHLLTVGGGITMRDAFAGLDIDQSEMQRQSFRLQAEVHEQMRAHQENSAGGHRRGRGTRGLFGLSRASQKRINRFLFPRGAAGASPQNLRAKTADPQRPVQTRLLGGLIRVAQTGDRWLTQRAPAT